MLAIEPVQSVTQTSLLRKASLAISPDACVGWLVVVCVQTRMLQASLPTDISLVAACCLNHSVNRILVQ